MGVLDAALARARQLEQEDGPQPTLRSIDGSAGKFTQGLKASVPGTGAMLNEFAGGGAEALAATDLAGSLGASEGLRSFAKGRYDSAAEQQQRAGEMSQGIPTWEDVKANPSLRSVTDFATGTIGQSAPIMGAGLGAALLTRGGFGPAMAAGTAATMPMLAGGQIASLRADPAGIEMDPRDRFNLGAVSGVGQAAIEQVVPAIVGGKVMGRTAGSAAGRSLGQIARRGGVDTLTEGATEGAQNVLEQGTVMGVNPDKKFDLAELEANIAGGIAAGAPLAGAGATGEYLHGRRAQIGAGVDAVKDAVGKATEHVKGAGERAKPAEKQFDGYDLSDIPTALNELRQKATDSGRAFMERMAAGKDTAQEELAAATQSGDPEAVNHVALTDERTRMERAQDWAQELMQEQLSPERMQQLKDATADLADRGNQAVVASMKLASDAAKALKARLDALHESVLARTQTKGAAKKSEDYSGIGAKIAEALTPVLQQRRPELLADPASRRKVADILRAVVDEIATTGRTSSDTITKLIDLMGDATADALDATHRVLGENDPAKVEAFYKQINDIDTMQKGQAGVVGLMAKYLKPELQDSYTHADLRDQAKLLQRWADQAGSGEQAKFLDAKVRAFLDEHYGDKAELVLEAIEKNRHAEENVIGYEDTADATEKSFDDETARTSYYTKDGDLYLSAKYDKGKNGNPPAVESALARARAANPQMETRFVPAAELGMDHPIVQKRYDALVAESVAKGIPQARAEQFAEQQLSRYGAVVSEAAKQETGLTTAELNSVKLDAKRYGDSRSRIDTVGKGAKDNIVLDAMRLTRLMHQRLRNADDFAEGDTKGHRHRLARMFMEGIAAVQEKTGQVFDIPTSTVIAKIGGKDFTWGEARKLKFSTGKPLDGGEHRSTGEVEREISKLRNDYRKIAEKNAGDERLAKIKERGDTLKLELERLQHEERMARVLEGAGKQTADPRGQVHETLGGREEGDKLLVDEAGDSLDKPRTKISPLQLAANKMLASASAAQRALGSKLDQLIKLSREVEVGEFRGTQGREPPVEGTEPSAWRAKRVREAPSQAEMFDGGLVMSRRDIAKLESVVGLGKPSQMAGPINELAQKYGIEAKAAVTQQGGIKKAYTPSEEKAQAGKDDSEATDATKTEPSRKVMTIAEERAWRDAKAKGDEIGAGAVKVEARARTEREGEPPSPKAVAAKQAALLEKARSGDPELLKQLAASDDAKGLQRAAEFLSTRLLGTLARQFPKEIQIPFQNAALALRDSLELGRSKAEAGQIMRGEITSLVTEVMKGGPLSADARLAARKLMHYLDQAYAHVEDVGTNNAVFSALDQGPTQLSALMKIISEQVQDPVARVLAKAINKVAGEAVTVEYRYGMKDGHNGLFRPTTGEIHINASVKDPLAVVLHEGAHAATVAALVDNPKLDRAFFDLLTYVTKHDESLVGAYGVTNVAEMIAEGFSNPGFQARLKKIPASSKVAQYLGETLANAWDSFVALVRKALGVDAEHHNALTQLFDLSGRAMKEVATTRRGVIREEAAIFERAERKMVDASEFQKVAEGINFDKLPEADRAGAQEIVDTAVALHLKAGEVTASDMLAIHLVAEGIRVGDPPPLEMLIRVLDSPTEALGALGQPFFPSKTGLDRTLDTLDTINTRLGELMQNDDTRYAMGTQRYSHQSVDPQAAGPIDRKATYAYIQRVLGDSVRVAWHKMAHAGEFQRVFESGGVEDVIRLSVHSLDPRSVAFHESLHAFFRKLGDAKQGDVMDVVMKAAESAPVIGQLRRLLADEPAALKQLSNPEERAAYMYQFWAAGKLKIGPQTQNVFQRVAEFLRSVLGVWSNDQRALHILEYFHSGEFAKGMSDTNATYRAMMEPGSNKALRTLKTMAEPLRQMGEALAVAGNQRLRDTGIPALRELADAMKLNVAGLGEDAGFVPAAREARTSMMNKLTGALHNFTPEQMQEGLEALQRGKAPVSAEAKAVVAAVRRTLDETYRYMRETGVRVNDLGVGKDYFPRVWDMSHIASNQKAFLAMLDKYVQSGEFKGEPKELLYRLTAQEGSEFTIETDKPGMQHLKERRLDFISHEDAAPFMKKDLYEIMSGYITQATRRAEWARRFGDDGRYISELLDKAVEQGASRQDIDAVQKFVKAVGGTLGDGINPTVRQLFGNMIVYQNIRLLPLAIFSSVVDPMGIMVRGGTLSESFSAFKRGVRGMAKNFRDDGKTDSLTDLAVMMGTIDHVALSSTIGQAYQQGMVGDTGRKINDLFFRFNLMERFNTDMRIAATEAATNFLARHADGKASKHSERWLAELGFRPGEIQLGKDGRIKLTEADGLTVDQAYKIKAAINRWGDGAVLRPDAVDKPIWMNDPHYALFAHLKQFIYSFQETIIKRAAHEYRHGNYTPAMALTSYVPIMIAADMVKGIIQGGGEEPAWKRDWGLEDYVWSGVKRGGLLGTREFASDAIADVRRGGIGLGALTGPAVEQMLGAVQVMGGAKQFEPFALKSMPANALYSGFLRDSGGADAPLMGRSHMD